MLSFFEGNHFIRYSAAALGMRANTNLFIMFLLSSAGLEQNEAFSAFNFFLAQAFTLAMLYGQLVSGSVDVFKGRENLRKMSPG
jgi:hypothetical protein